MIMTHETTENNQRTMIDSTELMMADIKKISLDKTFSVAHYCPFCQKLFNCLHASDNRIFLVKHLFSEHEKQLTHRGND